MALASEPNTTATLTWTGLSGRVYRLKEDIDTRRGSKAIVRGVVAEGAPVSASITPPGTLLALKLPWKGNPEAPDALHREARALLALSAGQARPACPRVHDALLEDRAPAGGEPRYTGLVLDWCPVHLESWWHRRLTEHDAFVALCEALAEVCERVRDAHAVLGPLYPDPMARPSPRIKPRNIAMGPDGRWLLANFEELRVRSLYDEHLSMTQPLMGGDNYVSPETLFNATRRLPAAMDTWSVGCALYALLRMRPFLASGAALPTEGTDSPHFRTHRMHLVTDLHTRKPLLLENRELDAGQFLYPDRLPDQDRRAVVQSVEGIFGEHQDALEGQLAKEILRFLDRALRVDPERRYTDPVEMARDLRVLAGRYRELRSQLLAVRSDEGSDEATMLMTTGTLAAIAAAEGVTVTPSKTAGNAAPAAPPIDRASATVLAAMTVVPAPLDEPPARPSPVGVATTTPSVVGASPPPPAPAVAAEPPPPVPPPPGIPSPDPAAPPPPPAAVPTPAPQADARLYDAVSALERAVATLEKSSAGAASTTASLEQRLARLERRLAELADAPSRAPAVPMWVAAVLGLLVAGLGVALLGLIVLAAITLG